MFEVGREHDGWYVEAQLGVGGMGAVYRCHKVALPEVVVAIKVVHHTDADAKARFRREAAALNRLAHPHVVRFRDVQCQEEPWYLVMDLAEGRPLGELMAEAAPLPLSVPRVADLGAQLASAIAYVHGRGLRHRDIKPANVIVDGDGRLVLVDFGIAVRKEDPRITTYGRCGSPSYAPPEWRARDVDEEAWDVYSLGQVLFEMCTGTEAFGADSIDEVILRKRQTPCLDPGEAVPAPLRDLIRAATALDPTSRPKAESVAATLAALRAPGPPPVPPPLLDTVIRRDTNTVPVADPVALPTEGPSSASEVATVSSEGGPPALPAPTAPTAPPPEPTPWKRAGMVMLAILVAVAACMGLS